ncbi:MAG: ATP-dependent sacrificial sulfur transferase LarE [Ignisphaera sp.]|nr:ATP-dependent sacrificial sulfur transferase LarE [Ignisphaera sp.]
MLISLEEALRALDPTTAGKLMKLVDWFRNTSAPVLVAFSGGVDSSVVLATAVLSLGREEVTAATAASPIHTEEDLEWSRRIASALRVRHIVFETSELSDPNFTQNPADRCYFCKKHIAGSLMDIARRIGARIVVEGTNASDLNSYRPGLSAVREAGIRSPLAEVGLTKSEVRMVAKALGLPNWSRPPMACLATRVPYGDLITAEKLRRIAEAERVVRSIANVSLVRVRDHGAIARIEVDPTERRKLFSEEVMDRIAVELRKLGYSYAALDLLGYRTGSLDEVLPKRRGEHQGSTQSQT